MFNSIVNIHRKDPVSQEKTSGKNFKDDIMKRIYIYSYATEHFN